MAQGLITNTNLTNIANAIRAKNGSSDTYTPAQMATAIENLPSGGSVEVINGIIQEYLASAGTVDANTFVEFAGKESTSLVTTTYSGASISAVALSSTKVFIAYNGLGSGNSGSASRLYGVVCTISGTTITAGTAASLSSTTYGGLAISATLLDTNKVFIAHNGGNATTNTASRLYGVVCTISGTTIAKGTDTLLSDTTYGGASISAVKIDTNKVFIAHNGDNVTTNTASRLYGVVCTISGTVITAGTDTSLVTTTYSGASISAVKIDTDKVFIAHSGYANATNSTSSRLYGVVCTISGTTITADTDTRLVTAAAAGGAISATLLDTNKVFIAHNAVALPANTSGDSRLYGVVCTISGTVITAGTDTSLVTTTYSGASISAVKIDTNKVFIAHNGDNVTTNTASRLYGVVCTISGTTITADTDARTSTTTYSGASISAVKIDTNKVFIAHNGSAVAGLTTSRIYGLCDTVPFTHGVSPATTKIHGLTKTSATTSTTGEMWVLET